MLVQSATLLPEPVTPELELVNSEPKIGIGKIDSLTGNLAPEPAVVVDESLVLSTSL